MPAKNFASFKSEGAKWITVVESDFYPDKLEAAMVTYGPGLEQFRELVGVALNSADLLRRIAEEPDPLRTQLLRIFRQYVSPDTSAEMLKRKSKIEQIIQDFQERFRDVEDVRRKLEARPEEDEAIVAVLQEYASRGQKGYALTEAFFAWFQEKFGDIYRIEGPTGAGRDIMLNEAFDGFEERVPADFVIYDADDEPVAVGFARYDSDRGGAQEDDRTGGNRDKVAAMKEYSARTGAAIKVIFINDGPGLLLGSMWDDYSRLEEAGQVLVSTLKMLDGRLTKAWLTS